MRRSTSLLVGLLLSSTATPLAWASGSAAATVASRHCSLTVRQTSRRSVPRGSDDFAAARKRLLVPAGRALPALSRVVAAQSRAHPELGRLELSRPVVYCGEACSSLEGARFPALVELRAFPVEWHAGHEYVVRVPFRKRPEVAVVIALARRLERALSAAPPKGGKPDVVQLDSVGFDGSGFRVDARLGFGVPKKERAFFAGLLARRLEVVKRGMKAVLDGAGVRLGSYTAALPRYEPGKPLPARLQVWVDADGYRADVHLALAAVEGSDAVVVLTPVVQALLKGVSRAD